ncbi:unnamed protein product [Leuciscus chuanchicus]
MLKITFVNSTINKSNLHCSTANSCSSGFRSDGGWKLSKDKMQGKEKEAHPDPPQKPHTDSFHHQLLLHQLLMLRGHVWARPHQQQTPHTLSVLDRHVKESRQPERRAINDEWVKDYLLKYVQLFPLVSCHLEMHVDRAIYGQGRFRSFTYQEMWQWYSLHKRLQADPQAGSDHERKMAQEAYCSIRQWLVMKEDDITTKTLKRFRQYILDGETPRQDVVPPAATATSNSSRSKGDDSWMDDALLVEALATFERQGDAGGKQRGLEEGQPGTQKLRTIAPAAAPASAPGLERTSDVTVADVTLQPCQARYLG